MRGAHRLECRESKGWGIIPANAGSTILISSDSSIRWDHPRECGEHSAAMCRLSSPTGSSPRMRGAQLAGLGVDGRPGIIPANAGSTGWSKTHAEPGGDHPRECGEHTDDLEADSLSEGSSPRMRGARARGHQGMGHIRIIPANAGSTSLLCSARPRSADHPRECGEHSPTLSTTKQPTGSSPRMRGARIQARRSRLSGRIIPANAGSTSPRKPSSNAWTDHPRECGEHQLAANRAAGLRGSSPRMRGARHCR